MSDFWTVARPRVAAAWSVVQSDRPRGGKNGEPTIRIRSVRPAIVAALLSVAAVSGAFATPDDATRETAQQALVTGDNVEAVRQYRSLVERNEKSAWAWYGLGSALYAKGERAQAASAFGLAAADRELRAMARFKESCARASIGQVDPALKTLEKAVDAGFLDVAALQTDESLADLRKDPRFNAIVDQARTNRAKVPARQFDFLVGTWDVRDPEGRLLGRAEIELRRKGHLLHATWTDAPLRVGDTVEASSETLSFYDPGRGRWRQVRVDDAGGVVEFLGGHEDGSMRFVGRETQANGLSVLVRTSYSEASEGRIRHVVETSADGGVTWQRTFDGTYVRRAS